MNNYHIYEEIGRGKYSVVYKGRKKKSIEYVAVKSVERGRRKKLMDEVAIFQLIQNDHFQRLTLTMNRENEETAPKYGDSSADNNNIGQEIQNNTEPNQNNQISPFLTNWHPNILKFNNWYETRNHYWIIFEYCVGGDLTGLLEQNKKLPEDTVKKFAYEILEGLSYLHSQGIIFGDLKPSNILMNEYNKLKLSDFGFAKKITDLSNYGIKNLGEERASSHSQANKTEKNKSGTPYYMAPELFQDGGVYSFQSDFWSLGCILVEMATGKPPFVSNNLKDLIQQILAVDETPYIQVKDFSVEFHSIVEILLQKDPINRASWDEIKKHPWWSSILPGLENIQTNQQISNMNQDKTPHIEGYKFFEKKHQVFTFTKRIYQPQPHFDRYIKNIRKLDVQKYHQLRPQGQQQQIFQQKEEEPIVDRVQRQDQQIIQDKFKNLTNQIQSESNNNQKNNQDQNKNYSSNQKNNNKQKEILDNVFKNSEIESRQIQDEKDEDSEDLNSRQQPTKNIVTKQQKNNFNKRVAIPNEKNDQEDIEDLSDEFEKEQREREELERENQAYNAQIQARLQKQLTNKHDKVIEQKEVNEIHPIVHKQILPQEEEKKQMQLELPKQNYVTQQLYGESKQSPMKYEQKPEDKLEQKSLIPSHHSTANVLEKTEETKNERSNPNVVKQNNFFSTVSNLSPAGSHSKLIKRDASLPKKQGASPKTINNLIKEPSSANVGLRTLSSQVQNLFHPVSPSKGAKTSLQTNQRKIGERQRSDSSKGRLELRGQSGSKAQETKKILEKKNSKLDRFQFLMDGQDDEQIVPKISKQDHSLAGDRFNSKNQILDNSKSKENLDRALSVLNMVKDLSLFVSPLSKAQIKNETQTLISQTVQIGPVLPQSSSQNQGLTETSSNTGNSFSEQITMASTKDSGQVIQVTQPTQMKVPRKTIEQLIIHNSDTAVKPIVGNREIEVIQEEVVPLHLLKFTPWTSEEVIQKINSDQIDSHLSDVYNSIASNTTINEKSATLQYFESIIVNSSVSNSLINSPFMGLLKKMLEQIKSPIIKIRVCSVVGLLIRHSTIIDNELAEIDIASQLIGTLRDSNEIVRRRAIAALGEYMFYAATQLDDETADPIWELSDDAINIIVHSLHEQEPDQIVRFYACKTLENICAQSSSAGHRFATPATIQQILNIFLMEKDPNLQDEVPVDHKSTFKTNDFSRSITALPTPSAGSGGPSSLEINSNQIPESETNQHGYLNWFEGIRISAAIALCHLVKLNPQLFPMIFEAITPKKFCEALLIGNNAHQYRVQQAFITMLNLALHNIFYPQISQVLLEEPTFFLALTRLLDHSQVVIRGKCILTCLLLFKLDFRWITAMQQEIKFFNELDKLLKDNYKYVQCCLLCLAEGIQEIIPTIFRTISEQLTQCIENGFLKNQSLVELEEDESNLDFIKLRQQNKQQKRNKFSPIKKTIDHELSCHGDFSLLEKTQLYHITILLDLQINPLIRARLLNTPNIQAISGMLDASDLVNFKGRDQFISALLILIENLAINQNILTILSEPIIQLIIPVLYQKSFIEQQSLDIRSQMFKIYTDMVCHYVSDPVSFSLEPGSSIMKQNQEGAFENHAARPHSKTIVAAYHRLPQ